MTDENGMSRSMADWEFNPDYVNKLTGDEISSTTQVQGGHRSRQTFRKHAKPGAKVLLLTRKGVIEDPVDCLLCVEEMAIGIIQEVSVQVNSRTGLSLSLRWPRDGRPVVQEKWELESVGPAIEGVDWHDTRPENLRLKELTGLVLVLKQDLNEGSPIDAGFLEAP